MARVLVSRTAVSNRSVIPQVQNFCLRSEDLANATWSKNTGVTGVTNTTDVTDPLGGSTASKMSYDGSGAAGAFRFFQQPVLSVPPYKTYTSSCWVRTLSGTKTFRLDINLNPPGVSNIITVVATNEWTRVAATGFNTTTISNAQLAIYDALGSNSSFDLYFWGFQTAQTNWAGAYVRTDGVAVNTGTGRFIFNGLRVAV